MQFIVYMKKNTVVLWGKVTQGGINPGTEYRTTPGVVGSPWRRVACFASEVLLEGRDTSSSFKHFDYLATVGNVIGKREQLTVNLLVKRTFSNINI